VTTQKADPPTKADPVKSNVAAEENEASAVASIPLKPGAERITDVTYFEPWRTKEGVRKPGKNGKPVPYESFSGLCEDILKALETRDVSTADPLAVAAAERAERTLRAKSAAKSIAVSDTQVAYVRRIALIDAVKGGMIAFSPAAFEGNVRSKETCERVTVYAGDHDGETDASWAAAVAALKALGVAWFAYGSAKDGIPKPERPDATVKRRLLIALSRDVMPEESARLRALVPALLGLTPDASTVGDESRLFYVGHVDDALPYFDGAPSAAHAIDVDALLAAHPEASRKAAPTRFGTFTGAAPDRKCPAGIEPLEHAKALARAVSAPAVQGESGHTTLYNLACDLVCGLELPPADALALLWSEFNPRCVPPWEERERKDFDRKVSEAQRCDRTPGYLLAEHVDAPVGAPANTPDSTLPQIVTRDGRCWLRRVNANTYDPPLASRDVGPRMANLGLDRTLALPRRGLSIDVSATLEQIGRVAMYLERDFTTTGISWHGDSETLVEGYALPAIRPECDSDVETWLTELANGARAELYDWIAGCQQMRLTQPAAALALVGDPDVGKSLLAGALARLWGCARAVPLKAIVAQFDGAKTECPIWFDDECEAIKAKLVSSDSFRELLQAREHFYERKNQEKRRLRGCARVVLACNEPSDIRFSDITGPGAVQAIVDRLALFVVPRSRTDSVKAALARLRAPGAQDVEVDRIVRHLAWIQASVTPRVQRFLGARSDVSQAKIAAYAGVVAAAPVLFEVIREYLTSGGEPDRRYNSSMGDYRLVSFGDYVLWAWPSALKDYAETKGARLDLGAVQRAIEPFRTGERVEKRVGGVHPRFWPLDIEALCLALELSDEHAEGGDMSETDAALIAVSDTTASRLLAPAKTPLKVVKR
jgi:hypothetical protein